MLYIICILRILRVNFAKQMHQNLWYGMFALMSVCDICNLASWQCWIPTGKSVSLLEISHKIMLLVSAFLLELEHLIYRVYKKKLYKPEIALRLCKAQQCTKFFIEIGCLGTDNLRNLKF